MIITIIVVATIAILGVYVSWRAGRLDRLHARLEAARAARAGRGGLAAGLLRDRGLAGRYRRGQPGRRHAAPDRLSCVGPGGTTPQDPPACHPLGPAKAGRRGWPGCAGRPPRAGLDAQPAGGVMAPYCTKMSTDGRRPAQTRRNWGVGGASKSWEGGGSTRPPPPMA